MPAAFFTQRRVSGTGWETLHTARGEERIYYVNVANVAEADVEWSLAINQGGGNYNSGNAVVMNEEITDHDYDVWGYFVPLYDGATIGVRCSVANGATFTVYGDRG